MFLGLSLTTWLVIFGVFAIITPIVGKQIAQDSLELRNTFKNYDPARALMLFPMSALDGYNRPNDDLPIVTMPEHRYIVWMMAGGIYVKFLLNLLILLLLLIGMFGVYFVLPITKIFSAK